MADSTVFGGTDQEFFARRASFGSQAAAYAEERPGYPDAVVAWALEHVVDRVPLRVLDLGAGTGKLTEALLRLDVDGAEIVAVEPDAAMLGELRRRLPDVRALSGSAEAIPQPDGSVDAILVGQALHWFDLESALPEMARVLTPGGVLAGIWNMDDDRIPWVHGLKQAARSRVSLREWRPAEIPIGAPYFADLERAQFAHGHRRTAASMTATIATHSHVLTLDEPERAALLKQVADYLDATPETAGGEFDLPIVTVAIRARRTDFVT